jgi:3',5'-cyclic AMP phosphodiesterase CpdA
MFLRLAHISDLHFSQLCLSPLQVFSKRWIGNLNCFLNRKKSFHSEQIYDLIPLFQTLNLDAVLITGDLTTTSHPKEFSKAKQFVDALRSAGLQVILIPGNHDHYTQRAYRRLDFYRVFAGYPLSTELKEQKAARIALGKGWSLLALDCACATPLFASHGVFSEEIEENLERLCRTLPLDEKVILINHFPFFEMQKDKSLHRSEQLCALVRRTPQIKLYLHGHTHRHIIADLRQSALPIIIDSGCSVHKECATWNCIDIGNEGCDITVYNKTQKGHQAHFVW